MIFPPIRHTSVLLGSLALGVALAGPLASPSTSAASPAPVPLPAAAAAGEFVMGPANPANPNNPLAGRRWGVYKGSAEPSWGPYVAASGSTKKKLAKIALTPKAKFFGKWIPNRDIARKVHEYIRSATGGNPSVLVQMTIFRMVPWEQEACRRLPTKKEQASYKDFINRFARAVGKTRAAIVLQPDGPFARCAPRGSKLPSKLISYAAGRLSSQPNTSVYIEMGSADWFRDKPRDAVRMLLDGGVAKTRGFALDSSHNDSVRRQIVFGRRIVKRLANHGVPNRHFVIDTSDNGRPFTGEWWHKHHGDRKMDTAPACQRVGQTHCVTLGIRPTTDVAKAAWGLPSKLRSAAAKHVDGYLWICRPWLVDKHGAFSKTRALAMVKTTPF